MTNKEAVETIVEIERQFDVTALRYKDIKVWPIIRIWLYFHMIDPCNHPSIDNQPGNADNLLATNLVCIIKAPFRIIKNVFKGLLAGNDNNFLTAELVYIVKAPFRIVKNMAYAVNCWWLHQKQLKFIYQYRNKEILFYSRCSDHTDQIDNKFYNRFIDPMIDFIQSKYSYLKLELLPHEIQGTLPRYEHTIFLNTSWHFYRGEITNKFRWFINKKTIKKFSELRKKVFEVTGKIEINEEYFLDQVFQVEQYQKFFRELLTGLKTKVFFFADYTSVIEMGLIWACRKRGIKTVDIQHGTQGDYNGKYSHWTRMSKEGFELLPDFYWSWGEKSRDNIIKWYPAGFRHHLSVVGGNRWLGKWVEDKNFGIDTKQKGFYNYLKTFNKVILVTFQHTLDSTPEYLFQAMHLSPDNWIWLIRRHPLQRESNEQIQAVMRHHDIKNYEVVNASSYPLFALIKHSDCHVTECSSVALEALFFGLPTSIIHPTGRQVFENYINDGVFDYAATSDKILESISNTDSSISSRKDSFFQVDIKYAQNAINAILKENG